MRVLISGASVAGPTLAHWLARYGHEPTVVELAPTPRTGGYPIDVRGPAVAVAEDMGLLATLRERALDTAGVSFVDATGRTRSELDQRGLRRAAASPDIELLRGDLVDALYEASRDRTDYRFGDSIATIDQDADGVSVTFERGRPERFDLVVGADGLRSQVRALAFGPRPDALRYLGLYAGGAEVDPRFGVADRVLMHNVPGRAVAVYRFGERATALFLFRRSAPLAYDHRDPAAQRRLVADEFAGMGWRVPELLDAIRDAPDFYFDPVSQVRMPDWSRGRVALVGDAGYAPALLSGSGTTLAMVGACRLAGELAATSDHRAAFAGCHRAHRDMVRRAQRSAGAGGAFLVPATNGAIWRRDKLAGLSWAQRGLVRLTRHAPVDRVATTRASDDRAADRAGRNAG